MKSRLIISLLSLFAFSPFAFALTPFVGFGGDVHSRIETQPDCGG
jgi:hypothetical protein